MREIVWIDSLDNIWENKVKDFIFKIKQKRLNLRIVEGRT